MEKSRYLICRLALNAPEELPITKSQYESLLTSRNCLTELASLEEKFFAVSESYREVEKVIFDITINDLLYSSVQVPEIYASGALFGRQVASFMSVVRLYLDTIATHAREITCDKIDAAAIKALLSERYDHSFYYRVMEAIRNHAQHRAFPVHSASYGGGWDKERTENTYRAESFFEANRVIDDNKFKPKIRKEIEMAGGKVDLKACVRQYFSDLCEIHAVYVNYCQNRKSRRRRTLNTGVRSGLTSRAARR
ncbi:MAG: hypothetical protein Q8M24_03320 [Pseudolabrys sp.]|nr:hypothetical protein [Pseudolabrys sp.]MDP2294476.1 hypothetical protein [Pseudolabrys sp.]